MSSPPKVSKRSACGTSRIARRSTTRTDGDGSGVGTAAELGVTSGVGEGAGVGVMSGVGVTSAVVDDDGSGELVTSPEAVSTADVLEAESSFPAAVQPTTKPKARTQVPKVRRTGDPSDRATSSTWQPGSSVRQSPSAPVTLHDCHCYEPQLVNGVLYPAPPTSVGRAGTARGARSRETPRRRPADGRSRHLPRTRARCAP